MRVTIRKAKPSDARFVWRLRNSDDVRSASYLNRSPLAWKGHEDWFSRAVVSDPVYVVVADGVDVGYVRASSFSHEVSIALVGEARGRGVGKAALAMFVKRHEDADTAWIVAGNASSETVFRSVGFRYTGKTRLNHGAEYRQYKRGWVCPLCKQERREA